MRNVQPVGNLMKRVGQGIYVQDVISSLKDFTAKSI